MSFDLGLFSERRRASPRKNGSQIRDWRKASLAPPHISTVRGSTSRTVVGSGTAVLVSLLLFPVVPAFLFLPQATTVANGGEDSKPTSTVKPLPEFTNAPVVPISYRSVLHGGHSGGGDDDDSVSTSAVDSTGVTPLSGVDPDGGQSRFWTELFYRSNATPAWTLYMPPWNPNGRWFGVHDAQQEGAVTGVIPFDTLYTGGETHYEFATVAVSKKFGRESLDGPKANTTVDSHPPQVFIATPTPGEWTNKDVLRWIAQDAASGLVRRFEGRHRDLDRERFRVRRRNPTALLGFGGPGRSGHRCDLVFANESLRTRPFHHGARGRRSWKPRDGDRLLRGRHHAAAAVDHRPLRPICEHEGPATVLGRLGLELRDRPLRALPRWPPSRQRGAPV